MKIKRGLLLLLAICLTISLSGCRTRTGGADPKNAQASAAGTGQTDAALQGDSASADSLYADIPKDGQTDAAQGEEAGNRTQENPNAPQKEYDENASADLLPDVEHSLHGEGEENGASAANEEAENRADQLNGQAEKKAFQTVAAETAEQMGVSEEAAAADSALLYFTVLLQDRLGSLFECQRLNAYWETPLNHVTIHKTGPEHALLLNAGLYDVSARLLPENLLVDDGWVARKNPGIIVKIVESSVLGRGVHSAGNAKAILDSLRVRADWESIDAVKTERILLLSQELLETPYLQTAAMVIMAKTAYPALFSDVNLDDALRMLTEEATGALPAGISYYCEEEGT